MLSERSLAWDSLNNNITSSNEAISVMTLKTLSVLHHSQLFLLFDGIPEFLLLTINLD